MKKNDLMTDGSIMNKIYLIRGQKVMLVVDLAKLYNETAKASS